MPAVVHEVPRRLRAEYDYAIFNLVSMPISHRPAIQNSRLPLKQPDDCVQMLPMRKHGDVTGWMLLKPIPKGLGSSNKIKA
jgi:hypothetical protein